MSTTGSILLQLKARAGLSLDRIAKAAGYAGRSSVQRYFSDDFEDYLDVGTALKLFTALGGLGDPPIVRAELIELTGAGAIEAKPTDVLAPRYRDLEKDVPVYGTALGTFKGAADGEMIEQTNVEPTPMDWFLRPPGLAGRKGVYGVYIVGSSQSPRYEEGEIAFVDPARRPAIGDDVLVYLYEPIDDSEQLQAVLIKRLVRRTASSVTLLQFNPRVEFTVDAQRVKTMHRVLRSDEMLAVY